MGRILPYLLDQTPSVVTTSDAGTGVGYTGLRIRGTDGTRINVTLNGVPVNEAESHGVFFVDLPDLASSTQSIQVQIRGAGPSTNGAGAFGASLNVETLGNCAQRLRRNQQHGRLVWDLEKHAAGFGTGLLNGHFTVDARASRVAERGLRGPGLEPAEKLVLWPARLPDSKTLLRAMVLTGYETTYQSWYGLADSLLHRNRRYNEAGTDAGQHRPAYKNQTDNYQQDYYQFTGVAAAEHHADPERDACTGRAAAATTRNTRPTSAAPNTASGRVTAPAVTAPTLSAAAG